ncbi:hypothetical protein, partial [Bradyrhizobium sp.]|uniref:hypothetical protein n=1 Tax=Bradyrhizobium sp. TaxID=376 RepID=UPI0025BFB670
LGFYPRFVWRKLPSDERLLRGLERRSEKHCNPGDHWLDEVCRESLDDFGTRDIGFFELCAKFDSIEIWVDPLPNDQLVLVWLLDLLRPYKEITTKLSLVHADDTIGNYAPESVAKWKLPAFKVTENHLVTASRVWRAYRAETPESCFDLLMTDLMIMPRLRPALIALLEELPDSITGLGATEMDLLDYVNDGQTDPRLVENARWIRDVFDENDARDALNSGVHCSPAKTTCGGTTESIAGGAGRSSPTKSSGDGIAKAGCWWRLRADSQGGFAKGAIHHCSHLRTQKRWVTPRNCALCSRAANPPYATFVASYSAACA